MEYIIKQIPLLIGAIPTTLLIAISVSLIGLILGVVGALVIIHKVPFWNRVVTIYLTIIRGIPALILIYIAYYGIPP